MLRFRRSRSNSHPFSAVRLESTFASGTESVNLACSSGEASQRSTAVPHSLTGQLCGSLSQRMGSGQELGGITQILAARHSWTGRTSDASGPQFRLNSDTRIANRGVSERLLSAGAAAQTRAPAYLPGVISSTARRSPAREHPSSSDDVRQWFPSAPLAAATSSEEAACPTPW